MKVDMVADMDSSEIAQNVSFVWVCKNSLRVLVQGRELQRIRARIHAPVRFQMEMKSSAGMCV